MSGPDVNDPAEDGAGGDRELDRRLRQLAAEQAAASPPPLPWDQVERRPAPPARPDRRPWGLVAAAAIVAVAAAAVVVLTGRDADAPTTLTPGDPSPATTPSDPTTPGTAPNATAPETTPPEPTEPTGPTRATTTRPDDAPDEGSVGIPHGVLVDGEPVGPVWSVTVANTAGEQDALWAQLEIDLDIDPDLVDPATHVVVHFGPAASSSCPFAPLADVRHDPATGYLYPELAVEGGPDCTDDANPHAVVVVIDRADLPEEGFTVWVENDDPPACCTDDVVRVEAGELATPPDTTPDTAAPSIPEELPDGVTESTGATVPTGDIDAGPDDLAIAHADGDLWYHPGALGGSPGAPFRLADLADPREPVAEGPPPNQVEHVAGVHDGTVIYGDCCEPVSGNVLAADGPDSERILVGVGYTPTLDPTRSRLATANSFLVAVSDLTSGAQWTRMLGDAPSMADEGRVDVWGVTWTADGASLVMLTSGDDGYSLRPLTGALPLQIGEAVPIGVELDPSLMRRTTIAGVAADGSIAVAVVEVDGTAPASVRFHDPDTLEEDPSRRIELGEGVTSVRVDGDEMLWVDGDELWHRAAGESPRSLGAGYRAAWFIR